MTSESGQFCCTESLFSRAAAYDTPDSKGRQGSETILDLSDTSQSGDVRTQPRAQGSLRIACKPLGAQTVLSSLYQKGSLKALFPRAAGSHMDAVFLNTAGGITGGDAYTYSLNVSEGASLRMTSQAAERVYKATLDQTGTVTTKAEVGDAGSLFWLPQETIVFDEARMRRSLNVSLNGTAEFLCVEPMVFGRAAMGETVKRAYIADQWRIKRDGKLIFADALKIEGNVAELMSRKAVGNGNIATAAIVMASPRAESKLTPLRKAIGDLGGTSLIRDGVLFARLLAKDSFTLRRALVPAIEALSDMNIPKTWRL